MDDSAISFTLVVDAAGFSFLNRADLRAGSLGRASKPSFICKTSREQRIQKQSKIVQYIYIYIYQELQASNKLLRIDCEDQNVDPNKIVPLLKDIRIIVSEAICVDLYPAICIATITTIAGYLFTC